jgi:hypothetical protein
MQTLNNSSSADPRSYNMSSASAAPSSGKKYSGFGSEDINRLGYNQKGQFNQPYDPYTKEQSAPTQKAYVKDADESGSKQQKKNKKVEVSSSDDSSSSSDADSDDSDEKAKKKRRQAKKAKLAQAGKPIAAPIQA